MAGKFASGQALHLRLFMEGVEVPVISATVSAQIGSPATAQIEIVATDRALELLPRTTVHLFYLDYEKAQYEGAPGVTAIDLQVRDLVATQVLAEASDERNASSLYNLFFCGELFSISYTKSGFGQRSVILQCLDFSNVWDTHYLYNLRYSATDPGDGQGSFIAGNQVNFLATAAPFDDVINYPELMVAKIAGARRVANNPALEASTNIVGSLFAVLELLGGVQGKHFGVNTWTTIEERRVRLMDQLAGDSGATATKLFEQSVFEGWLTARIGNGGGVLSFRDIVNMINGYIYYDVAPNPVGRYIPGSKEVPDWVTLDELTNQTGLVGIIAGASPVVGENAFTKAATKGGRERLNPFFLGKVNEVEKTLIDGLGWNGEGKPLPLEVSTFRPGDPKKHGLGHAIDLELVGLPTGFAGGVVYSQANDRAEIADKSVYGRVHHHLRWDGVDSLLRESDLATIDLYGQFYNDLRTTALAANLRVGADWGTKKTDKNGTPYRQGDDPRDTSKKFREYVWASKGLGWDPVHIESKFTEQHIRNDLARGILTGVDDDETKFAPIQDKGISPSATPPSLTTATTGAPRERMITQVFRPDVWFIPPPACNIVFPEEYVSFTFTRQMLREVTRLQLTTFNALFEDAIVNQYYFAPSFSGEESLSVGGIGSASKALIYPHEKFSGVVPKMERISEVSFYSKLSGNALNPLAKELPTTGSDSNRRIDLSATQAGIEDLGNKGEEGNPVNVIENYASRVAAYNFLTQRYAARTANLTGRFMPRVLCGWPMLVVNRPKKGNIDPLHFLGLVVSVSHTMSQGGSNTSVSLSHARSHRTGSRTDDLFSKELLSSDGLLGIQKKPETRLPTVIKIKEGMSKTDLGWIQLAEDLLVAGELTTAANKGEFLQASIRSGVIANSLNTDEPFSLENPPERVGPQGKGTLVSISIDNPAASLIDTDPPNLVIKSFPFSQITIYEQVGASNLPLEEAIRPPWFSEEYSNERVGPEIYQPIYGCPSLTDVRDIPAAEGETTVSIEVAADAVVDDYTAHADGTTANAYIYGTTRREYATLPDVMNSFHVHAYANAENNFGKGLDGLDIVGLKLTIQHGNFEEQQITDDAATRLDPRADRAARVLNYLDELLRSRGLRG